MGHNKRRGAPVNRGKHKRKKLNLLTIRQKNDLRQLGAPHPIEDRDKVKTYSRVRLEDKKPRVESSSDESEEDIPVIKQLMTEIGVKEEVSDVEESDDDHSEDSVQDERTEPDVNEDEDIGSSSGGDSEEEQEAEEEESDNEQSDEEPDNEQSDEEPDNEQSDEEPDNEQSDEEPDNEQSETNDSEDELQKLQEKSTELEVTTKDSGTPLESEEINAEAVEVEEEESEDEENNELCLKASDPFTKHFEVEQDLESVADNKAVKWQKKEIKIPVLGASWLLYKDAALLQHPDTDIDLKKLHVKQKLCSKALNTNRQLANVTPKPGASLTPLQQQLFSVMNSYQDLLYPKETVHNLEELRLVYTLHALNHVLKTRSRVIAHNTKLKNKKADVDDDIEYRDQGLTRPKVLIILPYRDKALKVVNMIISLLSSTEQASVSNKKRFEGEYSELENSELSEKGFKPEDFRKIFEGNTDDNFRVGMSVSKKSLRLYSPFYESDIILASPLGLRMIIGLEGDKERDFDFLSSIELLIIDQADIFLMQNWDHFLHVFKHLHLQPKEYHNVDFSRVRMWSINGLNKQYRQTLMFSSVVLPEIVTIFNKHCHNYAGKLFVQREEKLGTIRSSVSDAPQIFHRVACDALSSLSQRNAKFEYLKKKIIPYHTSAGMKQTLIYCNYYSFVHLRNFFRESETDFLFINEYDTERHVRNARIHFRKRHPHFMLYTERLHFHYRFRLRGIHHIVWFDLPQYPHYYPELVNLMETTHHACTSTVLFTRYDAQKLTEIVGCKRAAHMLTSEKSVNMITVS